MQNPREIQNSGEHAVQIKSIYIYIFRPFTDLGAPPHPPRVWKIGILQEMSRNSIIPDIDRDNCLASRKIFSAITLAKHPF